MKKILIDLFGVLLSKDGAPRPFIEYLLQYCIKNKIYIIIYSKENCKNLFISTFPNILVDFSSGDLPKDTHIQLFLSTNNEHNKIYHTILTPYYTPNKHNDFANISLVGKLLDIIKDRVVLNRYAPEKKTEDKDKPKEKPPEDMSNWSFAI